MAFGRTTNIVSTYLLITYLRTSADYPAVANAFVKLNRTPASSAAVERLYQCICASLNC